MTFMQKLCTVAALMFAMLMGGCATTAFDAPARTQRIEEQDETLSWWRLPDRSGRFEVKQVASSLPADLPDPAALTVAPQDLYERLRRGFSLPELNTARVRQRQAWYAQRPELMQRILERANRHLFHILEEIEKRKLPAELALVPFIESGFDSQAVSSAQAVGLWQFMSFTATRYKLRLDDVRDERRDVLASTNAALDYLSDLYGMFGDWQLALASYNWGEKAVARAVERNRATGRPTTYANLTMPDETSDYVPKLQAVKNLLLNPGELGPLLPPMPNRPYLGSVRTPADLSLRDAVRLSGLPAGQFVALNSAFNGLNIPKGDRIVLPVDTIAEFETRMQEHLARRPARGRK
jgi:membrane-bound lytic murein transglycosylase D